MNVNGLATALNNVLALQDNRRSSEETEKQPWPLLRLLESSLLFKATQPSDRIYALLGLANEKDTIAADYSMEVVDVYTEATRHILCSPQRGSPFYGLRVLASVKRPETGHDTQWPSWVQKWQDPDPQPGSENQKIWYASVIYNELSSENFRAGGVEYSSPKDAIPYNPYSVLVEGFVFDSISSNVHLMRILPLWRPRF
jgi:hypothetical protein